VATVKLTTAVSVAAAGGHAKAGADAGGVRRTERGLGEARAVLEARGIGSRRVDGHGEPGDVFIDEARESNADLIVVGTRGVNPAK
jgi:nucleotide-binding universal stress UspA family protein